MCAICYCITLFAVSNCVIYTKTPVARIVSFCNPPVVVSGEEGTTRPRFCGRSCGKRSELRRSSAGAGVSLLLPFLCRFPGAFPEFSRRFPGAFPGSALLPGIAAGDFLRDHYLAGRGKASPPALPERGSLSGAPAGSLFLRPSARLRLQQGRCPFTSVL